MTASSIRNLITHCVELGDQTVSRKSLRRALHNVCDNMIENGDVDSIVKLLTDQLPDQDIYDALLSHKTPAAQVKWRAA